MATVNNKNNDLKSQAQYINKLAVEVSSDIVKLAVKNGETSTEILSKMMKGGVTLAAMQQDFALTVLEKVADNVKGNKYFKDSVKRYEDTVETVNERVEQVKENKYVKDSLKRFDEAKETAVERMDAVIANKYVQDSLKRYEAVQEKVAERVELVKEKATEAFNQVKANLNNLEIKETVQDAVEDIKETVEDVVETVETSTKEIVAEATTKVDNITTIKGLGAKSAEVLNAAGYDSFDKLANATEEELREVLANAGASFKKFNPAPWIEAAKDMTK